MLKDPGGPAPRKRPVPVVTLAVRGHRVLVALLQRLSPSGRLSLKPAAGGLRGAMAGMKKFDEWHPVAKHICIVLALLVVAVVVFYGSVNFSTTVVSSALGDLIPLERKAICQAASSSDAIKTATPLLPGLADY